MADEETLVDLQVEGLAAGVIKTTLWISAGLVLLPRVFRPFGASAQLDFQVEP